MCEGKSLEAEARRVYNSSSYAESEDQLVVELVVLDEVAGDGGWDAVWDWLLQPEAQAVAGGRDG